jgi:hypothetical protein
MQLVTIPHNNFSSVYWIFTKLGHMIPLWKGKNPIYFGVIRSKVKVTYYKYNFWQQGCFCTITLILYIGYLPNLATWFPCGRGRTLFILGSLPIYRLIIYIDGRILWCTHFLLTFLIQELIGARNTRPAIIEGLGLWCLTHVAKFGKYPIYRTKVIVWKRSCCQKFYL